MNPPASSRETFPPEELLKYAGKWVAFSPDGTKIVASHEDPGVLGKLVQAAGFDLQHVVFEGIPEEDTILGGLS